MPKTISPEQAKALSKHLDRLDLASLKQLTKANIPFVTTLARNKVYKKTGKFEAVEEPKQDMPDDKEKVAKENSDKEIASLKDQIAMLKTKLENEKNKAVKPEPNPETGEVPLTVGIAYKHFKDKKEKEEVKKEDVSEKVMSDKEKRMQRAKDMIKYYDAQKKAALKGKNKDLAKKMLKNDLEEADLTKSQIKQVHKVADDLPKKDFKDRYGKEKGDAVRFGTATNMVKKKLGMKESKEQKLRNMKTVIDMLDGTHGRIIASKSDLQKLMNLTKKMNKLENPRGPSSSEKRDYENLVKKYSNQLGSKRNEYLGYLKDIMKEQTINEDRRLYVETIAGLKKKAEKSGMPYSILKKVYDRGMAAWKSGHRPGASQQQWAFARVNSFVTKSSGTWGGADKDLAKQVKG